MRDRRLVIAAGGVLVVVALVVAAALGAFKSDAERARESVERLMESYVVPVENEEGEVENASSWPADDYGDAATMEALEPYGVDPEQWRRHCLAGMSYEVGDAVVEGEAATVGLTVTNASLSAAVEGAGTDFTAFQETQEAVDLYAQGGKAALFTRLVEGVYARLDADEQPVVTTVSVSCVKSEDGSWQPQVSGDAAFFSALYGGSDVLGGLASGQ